MTAVAGGGALAPIAPGVEERLDQLCAQVAELAVELRQQREARERWEELAHELVLVSRGAMDVVTRELDDLSAEVTADDLAEFSRTLARSLPKLEALLIRLDSMAELGREVTSLAGAGMAKLSDTLAEAQRKGYFAFASGGAGILERVVTSFTEEDVHALGDNIVLILNAIREMTQPEVMDMLRRTALTAQREETASGETPSMLSLLKQMREPPTRRGLARVVAMLHTVGEEGVPPADGASDPSRKKGV